MGKGLVVSQVALSVALVSAAGLFIGHLTNLKRADLGFRPDHILLVTLDAARSGYGDEQLSRAYRELPARLEAIPGVRSATMLSGPGPLSGAGAGRFVTVESHPERPADRRYVSVNWVAPKYFETLGTPLVAGRDFRLQNEGGSRVAIVNRAMARYYFGDDNPIGRYFTFDGESQPHEIVGLAGDAKYYQIRETAPRTIYLDALQLQRPPGTLALRTGIDPQAVAPAVRRAVRAMLKDVQVARVTTLAGQVDATIVPERLIATLSGAFGALGSLLVAIGIYGLLAYTVARRVGEIGIRMALGATPGTVSRMVVREALGMSCAGLGLGAIIAYWGKRLAGSLMPDLPVEGVLPILFGAAAMIAITSVAAYVPAASFKRCAKPWTPAIWTAPPKSWGRCSPPTARTMRRCGCAARSNSSATTSPRSRSIRAN